jgi:hypothetical protein
VKKLVVLLSSGAILALVAAAFAVGAVRETHTLSGKLTAKGEVPKAKAPAGATGTFNATLTGRKLKWKLTFSHLSGPALAAHIHKGGSTVSGPVIVPLCGPCHSGQAGTMRLPSDVADVIEKSKVYVNVHTAKNKGGEIRSQLKVTE